MILNNKKFFKEYLDPALAQFMSKNGALRKAFEKAGGVKLQQCSDRLYVFAGSGDARDNAIEALQELSKELATIPQDKFDLIVGKMNVKRFQG
jgi:hypothetical protein